MQWCADHHCWDTWPSSDMQAAELHDARETHQHLQELLAARPELQAGKAVADSATHSQDAAPGGDRLAASSEPQHQAPPTEAQAQASPAAAAGPPAERGSGGDMPDSLLRGAVPATNAGPAAAPEAEAVPDAGDSSGRASAATGSDQSSSAPQPVPEPPADSFVAVSQVGRCTGPCGKCVFRQGVLDCSGRAPAACAGAACRLQLGFCCACGSAAVSSRSQLQACRKAQLYTCNAALLPTFAHDTARSPARQAAGRSWHACSLHAACLQKRAALHVLLCAQQLVLRDAAALRPLVHAPRVSLLVT